MINTEPTPKITVSYEDKVDLWLDELGITGNPRGEWRDEASCNGYSKIFLSARESDIEEAKVICINCPVATDCLIAALREKDSIGVRGGYSEKERKSQLRRIGKIERKKRQTQST